MRFSYAALRALPTFRTAPFTRRFTTSCRMRALERSSNGLFPGLADPSSRPRLLFDDDEEEEEEEAAADTFLIGAPLRWLLPLPLPRLPFAIG